MYTGTMEGMRVLKVCGGRCGSEEASVEDAVQVYEHYGSEEGSVGVWRTQWRYMGAMEVMRVLRVCGGCCEGVGAMKWGECCRCVKVYERYRRRVLWVCGRCCEGVWVL